MSEFNTPEGKKWLHGVLKSGKVKVSFIKKDGTEREMNCTLKEDLTELYQKKTDKTKPQNNDVCPVFDLDSKGWRSFRYDSIRKIYFEL